MESYGVFGKMERKLSFYFVMIAVLLMGQILITLLPLSIISSFHPMEIRFILRHRIG